MSYAPQPGTVAYRAIGWLQKQPAGHEVTISVWAEAIDVPPSTLGPSIQQAVDAGVLRTCTKHGLVRPRWYSLGDGKPLQVRKVVGEEDERDPLPQRTSAPDVKPKPGEVLPGIQVPRFRDTLAVHAALDAAAAREPEPQVEAVADAQVVVASTPDVKEAASFKLPNTHGPEIKVDVSELHGWWPMESSDVGMRVESPQAPANEAMQDAAARVFELAREKVQTAPVTTEPDPFDFCIRRSGALQVWGAEALPDGSFRISAEQLLEIRRLVAWLPAPRSEVQS